MRKAASASSARPPRSCGKLWVGYFDEGVYGNFGWGGPGPAPIGATGIARFTETLHPEWHFPTDDLSPIDDCYALNVGLPGCTDDDSVEGRARQ
ncbi:hypothetical protein [Micromonospora sp. NPDC049497]|uniref:hypothetical protein n=1 Tax=Micromonospora sp. NPDC049497 TaxID=3364273 RepID=UPI0037B799B9